MKLNDNAEKPSRVCVTKRSGKLLGILIVEVESRAVHGVFFIGATLQNIEHHLSCLLWVGGHRSVCMSSDGMEARKKY